MGGNSLGVCGLGGRFFLPNLLILSVVACSCVHSISGELGMAVCCNRFGALTMRLCAREPAFVFPQQVDSHVSAPCLGNWAETLYTTLPTTHEV